VAAESRNGLHLSYETPARNKVVSYFGLWRGFIVIETLVKDPTDETGDADAHELTLAQIVEWQTRDIRQGEMPTYR
jgi:hypothetical protein